jgi:hypothetical protein
VELSTQHPIFIGFKMDSSLRRELDNLTGAERKYVSREDPSFLLICTMGKDSYVGKLIEDNLSTDRVDDIRRNILSILHRLCPDTRIPENFQIRVISRDPFQE